MSSNTNNTIKISQCDNELVLYAVNHDATDCYEICNIKSGNNNPVEVTIDLQEGSEASKTITANGVAIGKSIHLTSPFSLPAGKYTLLYSGLNWGGPYNFNFTFNGVDYDLVNNPKNPLFGVIWNRGNDEIQFEIS